MTPGRRQQQEQHRVSLNETTAIDQHYCITSNEDIPVSGVNVPFEGFLAQELRQGDKNGSITTRKNWYKKPFLRKGSRGWWRKRPHANKKGMKYTLASTTEHQIPEKMVQKLQMAREIGTLSVKRHESDASRTQCMNQKNEVAVSTKMMMHSSTSIDLLGMRHVRRSFEATQEREAHDMVEFEALERDLAAEKEAFLKEKQQHDCMKQHHPNCCDEESDDDKNTRVSHSSFVTELHEQEQDKQRTVGQDSSFDESLNQELDSALLCDDYAALMKENEMLEQDEMAYQHQDRNWNGNSALDLSVVSFDDMMSWKDDALHSRQGQAHEQSSTIATAGLLVSSNKQSRSTDGSIRHQEGQRRVYNAEQDVQGSSASFFYDDDMSSIGDSSSIHAMWKNASPPHCDQDRSLTNVAQTMRNGEKLFAARVSTKKARGDNKRTRQARMETAASLRGPESLKSGSDCDNLARSRDQLVQPAGSEMILPAVIEEKLCELEAETKFYKEETLQLQKQKNYYHQEMKKLALERDKFERLQQKQRRLVEQEWERECTTIKQEAMLQERHEKPRMSSTISHQYCKGCGDKPGVLNAQFVKMQIDEKAGTNKWKAENEVLRQRVLELEKKNRELRAEMKHLKKHCVEQWEQYGYVSKETQEDSPSISGMTVPSILNEKDELRSTNDVVSMKGTADAIRTRRNYSYESLPKTNDENGVMTRSAYENYLQSNAVNSSGRKQYSFDRESSYSLNESETVMGGTETHQPCVKDVMDIANDANYALASSAAATCEWALPAAEDVKGLLNIDSADQESKNCNEDGAISASVSSLSEHKEVAQEITRACKKKEIWYTDGSKKILFPDGNEKTIDANGHIVIKFMNGDTKELFPDTGISVYYYYAAQIKRTTYPDNRKVYEYPDQQLETRFPDGTIEIMFPDAIKKTIRPNGDEFSMFPDGTTMFEQRCGLREVTLLNNKKICLLPDGQVVCVCPNGQEIHIRSEYELRQLIVST